MKKIVLILLLILLLTSCSESVEVNINLFQKNINESFGYEILSQEQLITEIKNGNEITYWFPKNYDICCALYTEPETGTIVKYTITGFSYDKNFQQFSKIFYDAISKNNGHIQKSTQTAGTLKIDTFEDLRYKKENENPTLKSNIDEDLINQSELKETEKPIN